MNFFWLLLTRIMTFVFRPVETAPPQAPVTPEHVPSVTQPQNTLKWDTPENVRHSIRVMCDVALLSYDEKNLLCACIYQESRFNPKAVGKPNWDKSRDWGLCQYNDNPKNGWIGKGKTFASTDEVLNDPEKNVRVMIQMFKAGKLKLWASYSTGAYKQWLTLVQHPLT